MALLAFPLESNFLGYDDYGAPIFDRAVGSVFYRNFWAKYFTDGIFYEPADNFKVTPAGGFNVMVKLGECHIRGLTAQPDHVTDELVRLDASSATADRTDRIVIRADFENERAVSIQVRKDWRATNVLTRDTNIWELAIADVLIKKGATEISTVNITDLRLNTAVCGVVTEPIKRNETTEFFTQLQDLTKQVGADWNDQKQKQQTNWQAQMTEQDAEQKKLMNTIRAWYTDAELEIAKLQTFDYDNVAAVRGVTRKTTVASDKVTEEIRVTASGKLAATRVTTFSGSKITTVTTVYDTDGETVLKSVKTECNIGTDIVETVE